MKYPENEMHMAFRGFKREKLDWKSAASLGLELGGGIVAFAFALRFAWQTNFVLLVLVGFVLWLIYITNKIA